MPQLKWRKSTMLWTHILVDSFKNKTKAISSQKFILNLKNFLDLIEFREFVKKVLILNHLGKEECFLTWDKYRILDLDKSKNMSYWLSKYVLVKLFLWLQQNKLLVSSTVSHKALIHFISNKLMRIRKYFVISSEYAKRCRPCLTISFNSASIMPISKNSRYFSLELESFVSKLSGFGSHSLLSDWKNLFLQKLWLLAP